MNEHDEPPTEPSAGSATDSSTDSSAGSSTGGSAGPTTATADDPGPRLDGEQLRGVGRAHRSTGDRYLAGVAGGLGRHFGVDPTIVRVLFVVLALFGGAGVILYVALTLLLPREGEDRGVVGVREQTRSTLVLVAAGVAAVVFLGHTVARVGGFWWPAAPLAAVLVLVVVLAGRPGRRPAPPSGVAPAMTPGTAPGAPPPPGAVPATGTTAPPAYVAPVRRPRRTGPLLIWPTLALVAIALGVLGIVDVDGSVPGGAYPALALAVIGVMLVVGSLRGRPGGLIAAGLLAGLVLLLGVAANVATGSYWPTQGGDGRLHAVPASAADVQSTYRLRFGEVLLDLTRVQDPTALDGRRVHLSNGAGQVEVVVPPEVTVVVHAQVRYGGQVRLLDHVTDGSRPDVTETLPATAPGADAVTTAPTLTLDLDARLGQITVSRAPSGAPS